MLRHNILLVDDQEDNLIPTKELLHRWGYSVDAVTSGEEAIDLIKTGAKDYSLAILDYRMPNKTGPEVAKDIRAINKEVILLVYSAYPSIESLTATIRAGVLNFIGKDEDLPIFKNAIELACLEYEKVRRVKPPLSPSEITRLIASIGMIGRSSKLARVAEQTQKFRESKSPVLILGETGVGKEMIANALHSGDKKSFYAVNCATLTGSSLAISELFGHEKGAFTGAINRKVGILEVAKGGTVYLDEIHRLDLQTQGVLLRALREKKIRRVGGVQEENIDFKLIASSWPDIEERVANGSFLPDLYYRIKFLTIEIPPLRERPEDIEPIVAHICERYYRETGIRKYFLMRTIRQLEKGHWKGNVGELDGSITSLLTQTTQETIDESLLDPKMIPTPSSTSSLTFAQLEARQENERRNLIQETIRASKSVRHASQKLGLKPTSLHTLITRLGIVREKGTDSDLV